MDEASRKGKRELLESLLEKGMVMVVLDARRPGVAVPPHLAKDPQLRLNLSWRFGFLMELDAWGVKATLTFGGSPFTCRLPWNSIYAMVSHASKDEQYIFPGELPVELQRLAAGELEEVEAEEGEEPAEVAPEPAGEGAAPPAPEPPAFVRRAHLAVVEGGSAEDEAADDEPSGDEPAEEPVREPPPAPPAAPPREGPGDREPPRPGGARPHLRLVK
jgi:stringent starvation protein B